MASATEGIRVACEAAGYSADAASAVLHATLPIAGEVAAPQVALHLPRPPSFAQPHVGGRAPPSPSKSAAPAPPSIVSAEPELPTDVLSLPGVPPAADVLALLSRENEKGAVGDEGGEGGGNASVARLEGVTALLEGLVALAANRGTLLINGSLHNVLRLLRLRLEDTNANVRARAAGAVGAVGRLVGPARELVAAAAVARGACDARLRAVVRRRRRRCGAADGAARAPRASGARLPGHARRGGVPPTAVQ